MVLSPKSTLQPATSIQPSDVPKGITHQPEADGLRNPGEDGGDSVLRDPETTLDGEWSSLKVCSQSAAESESFQVAFASLAAYPSHPSQVTSFLSDDDPLHLEEEVCRKHLLQTPIKVRVEVCVDIATSEQPHSLDHEFVTTSKVSSPSVPQSPSP